eukprot:13712387-Alexandrium_andersonii.AAC.1
MPPQRPERAVSTSGSSATRSRQSFREWRVTGAAGRGSHSEGRAQAFRGSAQAEGVVCFAGGLRATGRSWWRAAKAA